MDLTSAMIEQAQALQQTQGLSNLTWQVGDVLPLPFPDASFSLVFTRYSLHHFLEPKPVLAEMVRVCASGGRVVIVDVFATNPQQADAYNHLEKLRDPSHVRALFLEELSGLLREAGLYNVQTHFTSMSLIWSKCSGDRSRTPVMRIKSARCFSTTSAWTGWVLELFKKEGAIFFAYPIALLIGYKR
jgi:SAM-dependent methyltransferase